MTLPLGQEGGIGKAVLQKRRHFMLKPVSVTSKATWGEFNIIIGLSYQYGLSKQYSGRYLDGFPEKYKNIWRDC